jgi:hypothetical protein
MNLTATVLFHVKRWIVLTFWRSMVPPFSGPGSPGNCVCKIKNLSIRSIAVHGNINFYVHVWLLAVLCILALKVKFDMLSKHYIRSWSSAVSTVAGCGLDSLGFKSWKRQDIFPFRMSRLGLGPTSLLFSGYQDSFLGAKWLRHEVTTHYCLVTRLRMTGAIPLLLLYTFMVWKGKTTFFLFIFI